jgi:hypothetical protein
MGLPCRSARRAACTAVSADSDAISHGRGWLPATIARRAARVDLQAACPVRVHWACGGVFSSTAPESGLCNACADNDGAAGVVSRSDSGADGYSHLTNADLPTGADGPPVSPSQTDSLAAC